MAVVVLMSRATICARWTSLITTKDMKITRVGKPRLEITLRVVGLPWLNFEHGSPFIHRSFTGFAFSVGKSSLRRFPTKAGQPRVGVAIGDLIIDLSALEELGHFRSSEFQNQRVFSEDSLNSFLSAGATSVAKDARDSSASALGGYTNSAR